MNKVSFKKVKGRVVAKFHGGRATKVIKDPRKYNRKKKIDWDFEVAKATIESGVFVE
jgi:hypothetical protein